VSSLVELTILEIFGLQEDLSGFIMEGFCEWDESDAHAASSMISPPAQRLAPKALQSIDNLSTYLDYAAKLVLTVFHLFSCVADSSVIFSRADHFGDIQAARRSWRFHYGDRHLI
jgi:hypothetical protein